MPRYDLPLNQLRTYRPDVRTPPGFDEFWGRTLAEARACGGDPVLAPLRTALRSVDVADLTFPGFAGDPIRAWYLRPAGVDAPLPTVVELVGYGSGRGLPHERLPWPAAGYALVVMDVRGQGLGWGGGGDTADPHGSGPSVPGFLTRGVERPEDLYYRRVVTDAVRCLDAVRTLPGVDRDRVVVSGTSQGGALALAVAGLRDDVAGALVDVPFLCHVERAVDLAGAGPYRELAHYLAVRRDSHETVLDTLAHVDGVSFAARADAPALFSVGLADQTCPPSTVFAAYNRYRGPKDITVYPYNDHEGGGPTRWPLHVEFVDRLVGAEPRPGDPR